MLQKVKALHEFEAQRGVVDDDKTGAKHTTVVLPSTKTTPACARARKFFTIITHVSTEKGGRRRILLCSDAAVLVCNTLCAVV